MPLHIVILASSFAERVEFLGLDVKVGSVADVEAEADIICTVTSVAVGDGPVLLGENLRPHVHINAIGADLIGKFEVPRRVLKSAFVTADHRGQALREGEAQQLVESDLGPDLMELCARPALAAEHRDGITVFDSTGFALEDHVAFDVLLELAAEAGLGDHFQIEQLPEDALNPYAFAQVCRGPSPPPPSAGTARSAPTTGLRLRAAEHLAYDSR
ncbi:hypothetical protein [Streptomyces sp. NBC_00057]|uniref:hypothetical protein n=1 Tax=Streptomyces sp. NBC_00057 TaxID=2975634 RepID=UPI003248D541